MFGWINDCTEKLVTTKFGVDKWHDIKERAGCTVSDGGFVRHKYYTDQSTINLVVAASAVLGIPVDGVLEAFGQFFMEFVRSHGYDKLLMCQGRTLRTWLSNLNALHDHLESSLPQGLVAPVFWCEDGDDNNGKEEGEGEGDVVPASILLHYYSRRGSLLVPLVVGVVKEVARYHFDLTIGMERLAMQGEDCSEFTTWRITTVDPSEQWKLTRSENYKVDDDLFLPTKDDDGGSSSTATSSNMPLSSLPLQCPFTGLSLSPDDADADAGSHVDARPPACQAVSSWEESPSSALSAVSSCAAAVDAPTSSSSSLSHGISLSAERMRSVFPYHVVVDEEFTILQVGESLPSLIRGRGHEWERRGTESELLGRNVGEVLEITRPLMSRWDWATLKKLRDQTFFVDPVELVTSTNADGPPLQNGSSSNHNKKKTCYLKGNMVDLSERPLRVMFVLSPDAKNVSELNDMGLAMSDLPLHSFQRDAVFLGEHIASEVRSAHKLDKLSKRLEDEKKLSNQLLYSLLPKNVADELRNGKVVDPEHFDNVTLFFSDVVGFTSLSEKVDSWDVIDMLNELYSVMDFLAETFNCYKLETIGDAYICCSGLPIPDEGHAENIANFAIAVQRCAQHIKSPADGEPIQLRVGIHTGSCSAGVVGNLIPKYTIFGDMVNVAARHESTGEPGKIHCSSICFGRLKHFSVHKLDQYTFVPRGLVQMKGKGDLFTYWLERGTDDNLSACDEAISRLYEETGEMIRSKYGKKKRSYFARRGSASTSTSDVATLCDVDSRNPSQS